MKEITATLIGAVVGAGISALVSLGLLYAEMKVNFETDFQSSIIELKSAKDNIKNMINDSNMTIPKYKVLNLQIEWKEVLLNYDNAELNEVYTELNRLDNLRDLIIQVKIDDKQDGLIIEYKQIMNEIINKNKIDNCIGFIQQHTRM